MAETDPRTTIKTLVDNYLAAHPIFKDDGITNASTLTIWQGGPEILKYLFFNALTDYDAIISFGDPRTRSTRNIQDIPTHYLMSYPLTVTTVDKPMIGVLICTAVRMQYKITYMLRRAAEAAAQSGVGISPAYTAKIISDASTYKRVGGIYVWTTEHTLEYETDYA